MRWGGGGGGGGGGKKTPPPPPGRINNPPEGDELPACEQATDSLLTGYKETIVVVAVGVVKIIQQERF